MGLSQPWFQKIWTDGAQTVSRPLKSSLNLFDGRYCTKDRLRAPLTDSYNRFSRMTHVGPAMLG